jgi:hypothetical protein
MTAVYTACRQDGSLLDARRIGVGKNWQAVDKNAWLNGDDQCDARGSSWKRRRPRHSGFLIWVSADWV